MNDLEFAAFLDLPEANGSTPNGTPNHPETGPLYIHIRNWDRFQRFKDRRPSWARLHFDLHRNDAYMGLSGHRRAVLVGLWIEYGIRLRQAPDDTFTLCRGLLHNTTSLSRQLGLKVTTRDIESLNHAGFITLSVTETVTVGDGSGSLEVRSKKLDKNLRAREEDQNHKPGDKRKPRKRDVCPDCEVGAGLHAIDCPHAQPEPALPALPFNGVT